MAAASWFSQFLTVFAGVFLAEIGDKTMLVTLSFAVEYPARKVFPGMALASIVVVFFGIGIGYIAHGMMPDERFINGTCAFLFAYLAVKSFLETREAFERDTRQRWYHRYGVVVIVFYVFFVNEFADRTQFVTIDMVISGVYWPVNWAASSLALIAGNTIAILGSAVLKEYLPRRALLYLAAALFAGSAVWMGLSAANIRLL